MGAKGQIVFGVVTVPILVAGATYLVMRGEPEDTVAPIHLPKEAPRTVTELVAAPTTNARVSMSLTGKPDGPCPFAFDTGQPARQAYAEPSSEFVIRDGRLTYAPTATGATAAYLSTPVLNSLVREIGARWSLTYHGGPTGAVGLIVSSDVRSSLPVLVQPVPMHLSVTQTGWTLGVQPDNQIIPIADGPIVPPMVADGKTEYEVRVEIEGSRATIHLPNGDKEVVDDPRIDAPSNVATFEAFAEDAAVDSRPAFSAIWAN